MLKNHHVDYCFTFEASAHAYGLKKEETVFNRHLYMDAGQMIATGLDKFIRIIFTLSRKGELLKGV
jgi:hypothetical protein